MTTTETRLQIFSHYDSQLPLLAASGTYPMAALDVAKAEAQRLRDCGETVELRKITVVSTVEVLAI